MGKKLKKLWSYANILRTIPAILIFSVSKNKSIIKKDIQRWVNVVKSDSLQYPMWKHLNWLLLYYPEYRNLFYYRVKKFNPIISKLIQIFYLPMNTLYISTDDIGPGLFIQHGFSTIIAAKSIGENCWINQQVTIGYSNDKDRPVIGNNVRITAGAKIIGDICIGDNSIIGANAVVVKDVNSNCTVVGNPAFIIKRCGIRVNEPLHEFAF